jgi:hypothetical protein
LTKSLNPLVNAHRCQYGIWSNCKSRRSYPPVSGSSRRFGVWDVSISKSLQSLPKSLGHQVLKELNVANWLVLKKTPSFIIGYKNVGFKLIGRNEPNSEE